MTIKAEIQIPDKAIEKIEDQHWNALRRRWRECITFDGQFLCISQPGNGNDDTKWIIIPLDKIPRA